MKPYKAKKLRAAALSLECPRTAPDSVTLELFMDVNEEPSESGAVGVYMGIHDETATPGVYTNLPAQHSTLISEQTVNVRSVSVSEDDEVELVSRDCASSASSSMSMCMDPNEEPSTSSAEQNTNGDSSGTLSEVIFEARTEPCTTKTEHYHNDKLIEPEIVASHVTKGLVF